MNCRALFPLLAALLVATSIWSRPVQSAEITPEEARIIAEEAYVYLYPLITMDITRKQLTNSAAGDGIHGPMNTLQNVRSFPDANLRVVVRPNFDTLYTSGWIDLTAGPMVLSTEDTHGRYFLLPMLDMYTDVFAVPGKRTNGTGKAAFAVCPPGWTGELPKDVERIDAPTPYIWLIGRTQANGPQDYPVVHKIQDGYALTPLANWGKKIPPPAGAPVKIDPTVDMKTPPLVQVNTMPALKYFAYGMELMKLHPPHKTDWSILARMKRIGLVPGAKFDGSTFDAKLQDAMAKGAADGLKNMQEKLPTLARVVNGWQMNTDTMGVYGDYYLKRAIVAMVGLGANQCEDAIYPLCVGDAEGKPLMGESNYVIHFTKDQLPPVNAFWSVTMYDAEGFQVANPINRFAIGDRDALKFNADGSLDLYIQHASPGKDKESNWLPAPVKGELGVTMRLYAPKPNALDGRWNPTAVKKVK